MRPPEFLSIRAAKSLANWCSGSLSAASDIFITIGVLSCARAAPGVSAKTAAQTPAAAAIRIEDLRVVTCIWFSPVAGLFYYLLGGSAGRTLEDHRAVDNGH